MNAIESYEICIRGRDVHARNTGNIEHKGFSMRGDGVMDNHESVMEPLLTYPEAAKVLGVTSRTLWALVDRGELLATRFGRSVRIDPADLRAFIDNAKRQQAERN